MAHIPQVGYDCELFGPSCPVIIKTRKWGTTTCSINNECLLHVRHWPGSASWRGRRKQRKASQSSVSLCARQLCFWLIIERFNSCDTNWWNVRAKKKWIPIRLSLRALHSTRKWGQITGNLLLNKVTHNYLLLKIHAVNTPNIGVLGTLKVTNSESIFFCYFSACFYLYLFNL